VVEPAGPVELSAQEARKQAMAPMRETLSKVKKVKPEIHSPTVEPKGEEIGVVELQALPPEQSELSLWRVMDVEGGYATSAPLPTLTLTNSQGVSVQIGIRPCGVRNPRPISEGQTWSIARALSEPPADDGLWWHDGWNAPGEVAVFKPHNAEGVTPVAGEMDPHLEAWSNETLEQVVDRMYILDSQPPSADEGEAWNTVKWEEDDGELQEMRVYAGPMGVWGWGVPLGVGEIPPTDLVKYFA